MTAAVETSNNNNKFTKSIRWKTKLFNKTKQIGENLEEGVKGGKPTTAASPSDIETDHIQNVGGTGLNVNYDASTSAEAAGNKDLSQESRLEKIHHNSSSQSSLSRKDGKRKEENDNTVEAEPTSSAIQSRRGSVAPNHAILTSGNEEEGIVEEDDESTEEVDRISFFYKNQPYFWLSNSSDHPIYLDGILYPTAEHLFQSLKFLPHKPEISTKIRKLKSASDATLEARKQSQFVRKGWISQGENVTAMRTVLLLKFSQHSNLRNKLLRTGDAELVSDSPSDVFWGIASRGGRSVGAGRNELGKALMKTRETIRSQAGLGFGSAAKTV